mmetsp:Transcript_4379/g.8508  ORF Transcript_4379/g.8508 Transcript_4379/m.8508 type:complete len:221 (+) Transcript_4379:129-791(+)
MMHKCATTRAHASGNALPVFKYRMKISMTASIARRPFFNSFKRMTLAASGSFDKSPSGSKPRSPATIPSLRSPNHNPSHQFTSLPSPRFVLVTPSTRAIVKRPCQKMPGLVERICPSELGHPALQASAKGSGAQCLPAAVVQIPTNASIAMRPCLSSASRKNETSGLFAETLESKCRFNGSHGSRGSPLKYVPNWNSSWAPTKSFKGFRAFGRLMYSPPK